LAEADQSRKEGASQGEGGYPGEEALIEVAREKSNTEESVSS